MKTKLHAQVFISYRREGGGEIARLVRAALQHRGYDVFLDVEDLKRGPFNTALLEVIAHAEDFLLVLTRGCLDRCACATDWLRLEVAHAIETDRNIVPVLTRDFAWPAEPIPSGLDKIRHYNALISSHDYFDASMDKLAGMLRSRPRRRRRVLRAAAAGVLAVLVVLGGYIAAVRPGFLPGIAKPRDDASSGSSASGTEAAESRSDTRIREIFEGAGVRHDAPSKPEEPAPPKNISAAAGLELAKAEAREWKIEASLRAIMAHEWTYSGRREPAPTATMVSVTKWGYTFCVGREAVDIVVTGNSIERKPLPSPPWVEKLEPLEYWTLDAQGALGAALSAGASLAHDGVPFTLRRFRVRGVSRALWVIPCRAPDGGTSLVVDAETGLIVDKEDIEE